MCEQDDPDDEDIHIRDITLLQNKAYRLLKDLIN